MDDDVSCPACGRLMFPTTGGYFCPACRHRSSPSTIFQDGPATPPMGVPAASPPPDTVFDPALRPGGAPTPVPGSGPVVGASVFDEGLRLESEPEIERPAGLRGRSTPRARPASPAAGPATGVAEMEDEPRISFAEDDQGQGVGGDTVVIPGEGRVRGGKEEVSSVEPEHKSALFLPRCASCNKVLELEEIADGECAECRERGGPPARGGGRRRRSPAAPPAGTAAVTTGTLAALAATWAGVLVVIHAVRSNPDTWVAPQFVVESARMSLVLFAILASIVWACGRLWAGGAAVVLGSLAAALAAVMVLGGTLAGNLMVASAWLLAGTAGALAALAAAIPRREFTSTRGRRGGRAGARRRPNSTDEALASPPRRSRGRGGGVSRLRAALGGLIALGAAGVAGWQGWLAYAADPGAARVFGPGALRLYGLGAVALASAIAALKLFASPPRGKTHVVALGAAIVAAPLPAWLLIGPRLAELAGLRSLDAAGALALPAGLGRLLGVKVLEELAPAGIAFELKAAALGAVGVGLLASLVVLFTRSEARGRGLAGLALTCSLVWGAGLAAALAPPYPEAAARPAAASTAAPEEGGADARAEGTEAGGAAAPDETGAAAAVSQVTSRGNGPPGAAAPEPGDTPPPGPTGDEEPDF